MKSDRPLNPDERAFLDEVRDNRADGLTWSEISSKCNLSLGTLYSRYKSYEIRDLKNRISEQSVSKVA